VVHDAMAGECPAVDEVPEGFARAVEAAERRRLRDRSLVRSLMGWSVVALVVATPINFVLVLLGGLNASLDRTDPLTLLAADVIAVLAVGSAVIVLVVAPLLDRSLRTSRRAIGICRVLRRCDLRGALADSGADLDFCGQLGSVGECLKGANPVIEFAWPHGRNTRRRPSMRVLRPRAHARR
jgi:hypothetical protein